MFIDTVLFPSGPYNFTARDIFWKNTSKKHRQVPILGEQTLR